MKKLLMLFSLTFLLNYYAVLNAQTISADLAQKVAYNFYSERYNSYSKHKSKATFSIADFNIQNIVRNEAEKPLYFIVDVAHGGFVIVSADKNAYPVLGYSFDFEFPYPITCPSVKAWMAYYEKQIDNIITDNLEADEATYIAWDELINPQEGITKDIKDVSPLLLTTWDQGSFYNEMCPVDANGAGGHVYAGCVATSMAQVMKYYNYPIQGSGSNSYNSPPYGNQSANFGSTVYRWTEMPLSVTQSNSAVAQLLYHCGVSVDMSYGADGSSASTTTAASALKNNFKYASSASYKSKYLYSTSGWNNLLKGNLDVGRPMIYSGSPSSGAGHAWNCDGYQGTDYFHMNWGWSGYYNGFFYLNALNAGGDDFSYFQGAVVDIYPAQNYPYFCTGTKNLTGIVGTFDDGSGPSNYQNNSNCSWLIEPSITVAKIKLSFDVFGTENNNDVVTVYDGDNTSAPVLGTFSGTTVPSLITSNTGKVLVTFTTNATGTASGWHASYTSTYPNYCSNLTSFTALSDTFSDGSGSNKYNPVTSCRWRIMPPGATSITLSFSEFDLNSGSDVVEIYDVSSGNVLLTSYTGSSIPPTETYNVSKLMLWFKSNTQTPAEGFKASYTSTVSGMENVMDFENLYIYPNPASDFIYLGFNNISAHNMSVVLYNLSGQTVYNETNDLHSNKNSLIIPVNNLSDGVYYLKITTEQSTLNKKIIIQR